MQMLIIYPMLIPDFLTNRTGPTTDTVGAMLTLQPRPDEQTFESDHPEQIDQCNIPSSLLQMRIIPQNTCHVCIRRFPALPRLLRLLLLHLRPVLHDLTLARGR